MKLSFLLFMISGSVFAQQQENKKALTELDSLLEYKFRTYPQHDNCNCPMVKPGEKFPGAHPNAKYLNDTTLWEWRDVDFGGGWREKVYDLKPQYKDTLHAYDGSVIEVPVWLKNPNWKKPEEKPIL